MPDSEIIKLILDYTYFIIFPLAVIEGPVITLISGFLVSLGYLNFFVLLVVITLADVLGDVIYFLIGRYGGEPAILKWGKYIGINDKKFQIAKQYIADREYKTIYFGKFVQGFSIPAIISLAISGISLKKFLGITIYISIIKSIGLIVLGMFFGNTYNTLQKYLGYVSAISIVFGVAVIIFIFSRMLEKKLKKR